MPAPTPFTVVKPVPITENNLLSTSLAESDYSEYDEAETYAIGDRVQLGAGYHKVFESLVDTNLGQFPPDNPTKWVEVGPTNAWALFDESGGTVTTASSPLVFSFTGDRLDSMVFLGVKATRIRVQAENTALGIYYYQVFDLSDDAIIADWYAYFFADVILKAELSITDIPAINGSTYTITIESTSPIEIGTFVAGQKKEFGFTEYGARAGTRNYGATSVDAFGRVTFVRRGYAKTMDVQIFTEKVIADSVHRALADLRDTAAVYIGAGDTYGMLTIYGRYTEFAIDIAYPTYVMCSLQIEGLV